MATTVEYIIILVGYFEYKSIQVARIEITNTHFIMFDGNLQEIGRVGRASGGVAIVSDYSVDLDKGGRLRFVVASHDLYYIDDQEAEKRIECNVTVPGMRERARLSTNLALLFSKDKQPCKHTGLFCLLAYECRIYIIKPCFIGFICFVPVMVT